MTDTIQVALVGLFILVICVAPLAVAAVVFNKAWPTIKAEVEKFIRTAVSDRGKE